MTMNERILEAGRVASGHLLRHSPLQRSRHLQTGTITRLKSFVVYPSLKEKNPVVSLLILIKFEQRVTRILQDGDDSPLNSDERGEAHAGNN